MGEFILAAFIQTLHAFTYLVFMFLAGDIAQVAPIIGIIFLFALPRIEKLVKIIFNFKGGIAIRDLKEVLKKKG